MGNMVRFVGVMVFCAIPFYSCKQDPNLTKLQYMPDMADTPVAKAQRDFLDPPLGSVSMDALLYPETPDEAEKIFGSATQKSQSQEDLEEGKRLWGHFCTPCHGMDGKGGGTIVDKYPRPPSLIADVYRNRKDGFFFHRITFGTSLMPSYGAQTDSIERWKIIRHLRNLQGVQ